MINISYSLVIDATSEPDYFGFFSPDLEGFTGIGHSIEDCICKARTGIEDHLRTMRDIGLPAPSPSANPTIVIRDEQKLQAA